MRRRLRPSWARLASRSRRRTTCTEAMPGSGGGSCCARRFDPRPRLTRDRASPNSRARAESLLRSAGHNTIIVVVDDPAVLGTAGICRKGVHDATWDELSTGSGEWRRRELLEGLRALDSLADGRVVRCAHLDGSFVTAKEEPGDFDACWEASGVDRDRLDPVLLAFANRRAAQKASFGGESFRPTGKPIRMARGFSTTSSRNSTVTGERKGIVSFYLEELT